MKNKINIPKGKDTDQTVDENLSMKHNIEAQLLKAKIAQLEDELEQVQEELAEERLKNIDKTI